MRVRHWNILVRYDFDAGSDTRDFTAAKKFWTSELHHCRKIQPIQNMAVQIEMFLDVEAREVYGSHASAASHHEGFRGKRIFNHTLGLTQSPASLPSTGMPTSLFGG